MQAGVTDSSTGLPPILDQQLITQVKFNSFHLLCEFPSFLCRLKGMNKLRI
jgi:hypothetical protein